MQSQKSTLNIPTIGYGCQTNGKMFKSVISLSNAHDTLLWVEKEIFSRFFRSLWMSPSMTKVWP